MSPLEIILAVCGAGNAWLLINIKLQLTQMELKLRKDLISKSDFSLWTRRSNALPTFERENRDD